ncbi:unnamed protein product [Camellia sinensis]
MVTKKDEERSQGSLQEENREPLLQDQEKTSAVRKDRHEWMVYFSTFVASCGSYSLGTCVGYSSPVQSAITEDLNLSIAEYSLFGSILTFGAMAGAITSGPIADFIGRKGLHKLAQKSSTKHPHHLGLRASLETPKSNDLSYVKCKQAMRTSSAFCVAGWLAIYFAKGSLALDIGRVATGYGMGVFSYVVPVFIAEIAPKNLRGALTTLNQLMIVCGVSVSFIIGTVLSWRALALTEVLSWYRFRERCLLIMQAKVGQRKEFEAALQKLRGKDADTSQEAAEIQIAVGLMVCQQLGGINGVCFYNTSIFESAGFPSNVGTIIYACLQVVITALGATLIDKAGRKPLILVSASGLVLGSVLTAIAFYLKTYEIAPEASPIFAVTGILVYIGSFSIGMGAVPWIIMSEIFPINVKGIAGSLTTLVTWIMAWLASYTFNYLMSWSSYGTFILYGAVNAIAIVFVVKVVPETKGRTLEQIQAAING